VTREKDRCWNRNTKGQAEQQHHHKLSVVFTFVYVRRQTSHKHLTRETLDALPVLVGVTVRGAKNSWDTLVAVAIIEEIVINRKEGGAAW